MGEGATNVKPPLDLTGSGLEKWVMTFSGGYNLNGTFAQSLLFGGPIQSGDMFRLTMRNTGTNNARSVGFIRFDSANVDAKTEVVVNNAGRIRGDAPGLFRVRFEWSSATNVNVTTDYTLFTSSGTSNWASAGDFYVLRIEKRVIL